MLAMRKAHNITLEIIADFVMPRLIVMNINATLESNYD
jgi:hypothetical protein